jgi:hypothetical protein
MNTCQMFRGPSLCMPIAVLLDATLSAEHLLQHSVLYLYWGDWAILQQLLVRVAVGCPPARQLAALEGPLLSKPCCRHGALCSMRVVHSGG